MHDFPAIDHSSASRFSAIATDSIFLPNLRPGNLYLCQTSHHTLAVSGSAGLVGIVEAIAQPNGSVAVGPLAAFGTDKFAFVLAWVSIYHHSMYGISRFVQVIIEMRDVAL